MVLWFRIKSVIDGKRKDLGINVIFVNNHLSLKWEKVMK